MNTTTESRIDEHNFWHHPYVRSLGMEGRLIMAYLVFNRHRSGQIIIEDVALFTGLHAESCRAWIEAMREAGYLPENEEVISHG